MALQRELKKKQPFESLEQEAVLNLLRTGDRVQLEFARLFRRHGLFPAQYNILRILRGEGKRLPILEIAGRLLTQVPGITGLIDRLERAGLVARQRCDEDRRVIYVSITEAASQLLAELDEPVAQLHHQLLGHLSSAELKELNRLLEKARQPLTTDET
ncbi:MAG: MarR family transcriptional regulator [Planctomycetia bacterium]|nr:MarR family transcriptional regulator [Planctomycetia bacterium]